MTAPPLKPRVRTCIAKQRHPDEITARAVALRCVEAGYVETLYTYQCPECGGWHLTRRKQGKRHAVVPGNPYAEKGAAQ